MLNIDDIVKLNLYLNAPAATANTFYAGLIVGASDTISASTRVEKYASVADMVKAGFSEDAPEVLAAGVYFAQTPAPEFVFVGCKTGEETYAQAVAACLEASGDFWGVAIAGELTATQILDVDKVLTDNDRGMLFATIEDIGTATGDDGPLAKLMERGSRRTMLAVVGNNADDNGANVAYATLGRIAGLNFLNRDGAFSLAYKELNGVNTSSYTKTQVDKVKAMNGTVYVTRGYSRHLLEVCATGSGLRVDECLYIDMMMNDMQNAVLDLFVEQEGRLGQVDETSARVINKLTTVLNAYVGRGIIAPGIWRGDDIGSIHTGDVLPNGYAMHCDSYYTQSQADREARKGMPVRVAITLAGGVEQIDISVHAQR